MTVKAGYKTTEMWLAVVTTLLGVLNVIPLPPWAYPVIYGSYAIARGLAKVGVIRGTTGEVLTELPEKPFTKK